MTDNSQATVLEAADLEPGTAEPIELDAVIIGAGFSGVGMLRRLRDSGFSTVVLEAADGIGGTWYFNKYPGARCDSWAHIYCYSFSEELMREAPLRNRYYWQHEVLEYLDLVVDKFDLRRQVRLNSWVDSAIFDEQTQRWLIETADGLRISAQYCIAAVGAISGANIPEIEGIDDFEGEIYHTSTWPDEDVDMTGRRVAVVGTGASGVQVIPLIAEEAEHLTVFQRTPTFILPARQRVLSEEEVADIKNRQAEIIETGRWTPSGTEFLPKEQSGHEASPEERRAFYEEAWEKGGFHLLMDGYIDTFVDEEVNADVSEFVREKIRELVDDPELAERLMPYDHAIGTKRTPVVAGYPECFNRDNVSLVSVREEPILEATAAGFRTAEKLHELDVIVFATGYDAWTGAIGKIDIRGRDGQRLAEKWKEGPSTYLGVASVGFPNLFIMTGPGSPGILANTTTSIEHHVEWIGDLMEYMRERDYATIEPLPEIEVSWTAFCNEEANRTLMVKAKSFWMGRNLPGKKEMFYPYIGGAGEYRRMCNQVVSRDYEGFELSRAEDAAAVA
jgi:cation diffusion facilitator CzcD-associated flavoprotein CzcO